MTYKAAATLSLILAWGSIHTQVPIILSGHGAYRR